MSQMPFPGCHPGGQANQAWRASTKLRLQAMRASIRERSAQKGNNMNLEKLVKVMGYTASPNDSEALNAVRIANGILAESDLTWEQFISQKTIVIQEVIQQPTTATAKPIDTNIQNMLDICLRNVTSHSGQHFIQSLADWYRRKGFLTDRQKTALERWYNNV